MLKYFLSFSLIFLALSIHAQDKKVISNNLLLTGDTVQPQELKKEYDPRRASTLSAIFPGLGQIYNDSWWKAPIIYTGMGFAVYFIDYNNDQRKIFTKLAEDLLVQKASGVAINENALRVARRGADIWRKNRDLVFLTMIGVYGLNIIDASIEAHLKGFNVSDNLATFKPKIGVINNGAPYIGIGLTIPIRSR
ncbi:MAG: hypothetical protein ACJAXX_002471 [Roseivirga sp.]|jgi:hypothetical protein